MSVIPFKKFGMVVPKMKCGVQKMENGLFHLRNSAG